MPALDLTLLLPVLSLALLAGWGLTAWLLMRRSSALQEQLGEVQSQLGRRRLPRSRPNWSCISRAVSAAHS